MEFLKQPVVTRSHFASSKPIVVTQPVRKEPTIDAEESADVSVESLPVDEEEKDGPM